MLKFQINNQVFEQTTSKIVGKDVIHAMVRFVQQEVLKDTELVEELKQFLTEIFRNQSARHPALYSNQIKSQMEHIYDYFIQDLESNRKFKDSNIIHSYHEFISDLLKKDYSKSEDHLRQLLTGFTKESFVSTCLNRKFAFGFAKNKVPTENNELFLILVKICNQLKIECRTKLIYESEDNSSSHHVYEKLFALSPHIEKTNYVNPLKRTAKKSSGLLFLMHFWSDQYSTYAKDHKFKENVSVEIEEFNYDINRDLLRTDVEQHFRDLFLQNTAPDVVDLSIPMEEFFGSCTSGSYKIVISTRFQNEEFIEEIDIDTQDDVVINLHPEYGHDNLIDGCKHNTLVFSNPNSGKTYGLKQNLNNKVFEMAYQNPRSVTEWKKSILIQHISTEYYVGILLQAIVTASLNPNQQYYIMADEVGTFNLDWILGSNLKKIFKKSQRIAFTDPALQAKVSSFGPHEITLTAFKELGEFIAQHVEYATKTTRFSEGEHEFVLWLPDNLHVIFLANYEDELLASLSELKGWGPNGDRFEVLHYYAVENRKKGLFAFKPSALTEEQEEQYANICRWNSTIYNKLVKLVENSKELSRSERKEIAVEMIIPRLLIPTFDPTVQGCTDVKEYVLARLDDFIILSAPLKQKLEEAIETLNIESE